jgi:hypothetical protein
MLEEANQLIKRIWKTRSRAILQTAPQGVGRRKSKRFLVLYQIFPLTPSPLFLEKVKEKMCCSKRKDPSHHVQ